MVARLVQPGQVGGDGLLLRVAQAIQRVGLGDPGGAELFPVGFEYPFRCAETLQQPAKQFGANARHPPQQQPVARRGILLRQWVHGARTLSIKWMGRVDCISRA